MQMCELVCHGHVFNVDRNVFNVDINVLLGASLKKELSKESLVFL